MPRRVLSPSSELGVGWNLVYCFVSRWYRGSPSPGYPRPAGLPARRSGPTGSLSSESARTDSEHGTIQYSAHHRREQQAPLVQMVMLCHSLRVALASNLEAPRRPSLSSPSSFCVTTVAKGSLVTLLLSWVYLKAQFRVKAACHPLVLVGSVQGCFKLPATSIQQRRGCRRLGGEMDSDGVRVTVRSASIMIMMRRTFQCPKHPRALE